ncbi:MAG: flagellar motor protein MotB [Bdellovibrionia bacterium]
MANANITIIKKKKGGGGHGHHGGAWKVAYADFVTAMMAFFLVMWLMASDDETKASVSFFFNHPGEHFKSGGDPTTTLAHNMGEMLGAGDSILNGGTGMVSADFVKDAVKNISRPENLKEVGELLHEVLGDIAFGVEVEMDYIRFSISDTLLFEPESSQLRQKASEYLDRVGRILSGLKGSLSIEAHSADLLLDGRKMPSLYEASIIKSVSVMNYFVSHRLLGSDQIHPVVTHIVHEKFTNSRTPDAEVKNRRVEFVFTRAREARE